ncbi:MAG: type III pantothenate kinase [Clostridiales bacterium]|nr:type III pantothenate kinase [Clostridiales bacterium]
MLLAVDIGNSSIDLGVFDGSGALLMKSKMSAVRTKCTDEYAVILSGILTLHGIGTDRITEGIISSVVPPLTATVSSAINKLFGFVPIEVGPGIKTGLNIRIDSQAQLGADLVANSVAAISRFPLPLIIVDIGTATTFTAINCEGVLEGVIISPGIRMSLDALAADASELPDVSISLPKRFIAKNTNDSMNVGVIYGHAFMIDGFIDRLGGELKGEPLSVVVTGGLADTVLPFCSHKMEYVPELTLSGLRLLYLKNKK